MISLILGYHWDCSDWVRRSQTALPNITEVPGSEVPDSSSFHSNESNESNLDNTCKSYFNLAFETFSTYGAKKNLSISFSFITSCLILYNKGLGPNSYNALTATLSPMGLKESVPALPCPSHETDCQLSTYAVKGCCTNAQDAIFRSIRETILKYYLRT